MRVEYVSHASLRMVAGGTTLLTDPYFFLDPLEAQLATFFPPRTLTVEDFGPLDVVYCSHFHSDHSHPRTLALLRDRIRTLVIPAGRRALLSRLKKLGFQDVVELEDEAPVTLHGFTLTSYLHPNDVDSALIAQAEGQAVLHANDCVLSSETLARMRAATPIDVAFMPHTMVQDLYPLLLPRGREVLRRLGAVREAQARQLLGDGVAALRPKLLVPYAYGIAYLNEDQLELNTVGRTLPAQFLAEVQARLPEQRGALMRPGDVVDVASLDIVRGSCARDWGATEEEYLAALRAFAAEGGAGTQRPSFGEPEECEALLRRHFAHRLWLGLPSLLRRQVVSFHVVGETRRKTWSYDFAAKALVEGIPRPPVLEITLPASSITNMLEHPAEYDPFMALYSHRISFRSPLAGVGSAESEVAAYEETFVLLFSR
ncbi:MAG: MBL fold metallo-hydrolase [Myxococcota bacterium]